MTSESVGRSWFSRRNVVVGAVALLLGASGGGLVAYRALKPEHQNATPATTGVPTKPRRSTLTTGSVASTTTSIDTLTAATAWKTVASELTLDTSRSPIAHDGAQFEAATASGQTADLWSFDGTTWGRSESIALPFAITHGSIAPEPIRVQDVTGDRRPDFIIGMVLNGPVSSVLSNDGGPWRLIPFNTDVAVPDLRVQGRDLVNYDQRCVPDCASGPTVEYRWKFYGSRFVVVSQATTPAPLAPSGSTSATTTNPCVVIPSPGCD